MREPEYVIRWTPANEPGTRTSSKMGRMEAEHFKLKLESRQHPRYLAMVRVG